MIKKTRLRRWKSKNSFQVLFQTNSDFLIILDISGNNSSFIDTESELEEDFEEKESKNKDANIKRSKMEDEVKEVKTAVPFQSSLGAKVYRINILIAYLF